MNKLDKLIEEHETFKRNIRWESVERLQTFSSRCSLTIATIIILCIVFGPVSILLFPLIYHYLKRMIPDPERRDPFQRYFYK